MHKPDSLYFYSSGHLFFSDASPIKPLICSKDDYGLTQFSQLFMALARNMTFHDRTGVLTTPIRTALVPGLEMPAFKQQSLSFEEICNARAKELQQLALKKNKQLVVMYSGGVDSTLMLVSFIKNCDAEFLKERVLVLLNENSIDENRNFYQDHIIKRFRVGHSQFFNRYIGSQELNSIVLTGEGNDQLLGSQTPLENPNFFGDKPWKTDLEKGKDQIIKCFQYHAQNEPMGLKLYELLDRVCKAAPIPIANVFTWFWWINFSCKWQAVYMRSASFTLRENQATLDYSDYLMFYSSPEFQLWSMNNHQHLIGDTMREQKLVCKDIIFAFNKDEDYYKYKLKCPSLMTILFKKESAILIDEHRNFYYDFDMKFLNPDNSFAG